MTPYPGPSRAPSYDGFAPASPESSRVKQRVRAKDTKAELILRRALWAAGLRYRLHASDLPGRPDIVFRKARVAVFCDGDFFHGRSWSELRVKLARRANPDYWIEKIGYNRERDRRVSADLTQAGWHVLRFWETDIQSDVEPIVDRVMAAISEAGT